MTSSERNLPANDSKKVWSKAEIEHFLATEELRYQKIDLPYGLSTHGTKREELCQLAFRGAAEGRSILDIGSYLGYFCLRALEEGAASAHGLEIDPDKIRQANILADIKGLKPTYDTVDFETEELGRRYDIVLALNILHHLFDPVGALQKLARITDEKLVLEVASLNPRDARKIGIGFFKRFFIARMPLIFVAPGIPESKRRTNVQKFFFTPSSVKRILNDHTKLFARVEVFPSTFKQRFIVVATRRRIGHLVIVSGPTSSGKSTFIRLLKQSALPKPIAEKLPVGIREWPQIGSSRLFKNPHITVDGKVLDSPQIEGLVLHYDILRPYARGTQDFNRDQTLDLIQCAKKVTVIVLETELSILEKQLFEGEILNANWRKKTVNQAKSLLGRLGQRPVGAFTIRLMEKISRRRIKIRIKSRHEKLLEHYSKPGWVSGWIARWKKYLRAQGDKVEIVSVRWPPTR
jgi:2-polyprenyl-3-methyl-5-hydroxy-6-metoxy-1,4-benzoquinol methylase